MPTLLLEIGCEELPASACREAQEQLPALCRQHLGVAPSGLFVGPRRLALLVDELPEREPDEWRRGPAERVAYDEAGMPTRAAEGFARGAGVAVAELERREEHVWALRRGRVVAETLPGRLAEIVGGLAFGKSMTWVAGGLRFSRPVRWLCVKHGAETLAVELDGVPSGGHSFGHRFTGGRVDVPTAGAYLECLRGAGVEPDHERRRAAILTALDGIGAWRDPAGKLAEVVHLVESPLVLEGSFDERFLRLPPRVIETAMQLHQRYFPLGGARFAFVANGGDPEVVRSGNEQVLEGRLADASFTFDRDVEVGIDGLAARLGAITFLAGAGSFADKAERLVGLVAGLGGSEGALTAARLAKADQAAELVREFPDLEGHIGAQYARLGGHGEEVCAAIEEHFLPDAAGGPLPATEAGRVLAAADKLDTLSVVFGLGRRPTGSRDPYGLRRAAIGLCRLAIEGRLTLRRDALPGEVGPFVEERLESLLEVPVEFVRAARGSTGAADLGGVAALAVSLAALPGERLDTLHTVYTRTTRIAGEADGEDGTVDPARFDQEAEREVAAALERVRPAVSAAVAGRRYEAAAAAVAELGPPLERFFDDVLVMAEDPELQRNRRNLLRAVSETVLVLADFAQLPR